jgi:hypothetical protein
MCIVISILSYPRLTRKSWYWCTRIFPILAAYSLSGLQMYFSLEPFEYVPCGVSNIAQKYSQYIVIRQIFAYSRKGP